MRPVRLRPQAETDLVDRTRYYRATAGDDVATRFFDAAIASLQAVGRMPGAGSPRVGEVCDIPGLRARRVPRFPCSWFYFVHEDHVDVVRLLADAQDVAALLNDVDEDFSARPADSP